MLHVCFTCVCNGAWLQRKGSLLWVRVGDRRGSAQLSSGRCCHLWVKCTTGWCSSQVALGLWTCLILHTQLVFKLFSFLFFSLPPSLCRFQSLSLIPPISLSSFLHTILYVHILLCHPPLFTVTLVFLPLSSFTLKFAAVHEFSEGGKIPQGSRGKFVSLQPA